MFLDAIIQQLHLSRKCQFFKKESAKTSDFFKKKITFIRIFDPNYKHQKA